MPAGKTKVVSKYIGVYYKNRRNGTACWCAKYSRNRKSVHLGHFPLTTEGEVQARAAYLKYLESIGESEITKTKRIINSTIKTIHHVKNVSIHKQPRLHY